MKGKWMDAAAGGDGQVTADSLQDGISTPPPFATTTFAAWDCDRDTIARDKERLQRFHEEAMSFLMKAYSNDDDVLVQDRFDNPSTSANSVEDFSAQRSVQLDKLRLERFHAQAVSFLNRAYADEPNTIVVEETLSPCAVAPILQDKLLLQKFHEEAMNYLDAAAGVPSFSRGEERDEGLSISSERRRADRASFRIERDKARLEQHYQDAMSFLERADADTKGALVEEQDLEPAIVDRLQLQRYAQDAMSFLDKAFRNESCVMIGDEEDIVSAEGGEDHDERKLTDNCGQHYDKEKRFVPVDTASPSSHVPDRCPFPGASEGADEEKQIAADRAALQRCDEEFREFLSKAYLDDSTVIVDDCDSETTETDRGLYARRMAPSTLSAGSRSATLDDLSEEAYTDVEFQDAPIVLLSDQEALSFSRRSQSPIVYEGNHESKDDDITDDDDENLHRKLVEFEGEARQFLDGTHVVVAGEEDEHALGLQDLRSEQRGSSYHSKAKAELGERKGRRDTVLQDDDADEDSGDVQLVGSGTVGRQFREVQANACAKSSWNGVGSSVEAEAQSYVFPDRDQMSERRSSSRTTEENGFPESPDPVVDVMFEDSSGRSHAWSELPLEKSFYRQVPRGSTIKLRPRVSPRTLASSCTGSHDTAQIADGTMLRDVHRVEKERNALMAVLEEILNERSMLAVQLCEMKAMIRSAGGGTVNNIQVRVDEDVDLAAELREAHTVMSKMTEEMEVTLGVLDARYQDTLERAHKAEERCIRLESKASRLEKQCSMQERQLFRAIAEDGQLTAVLSNSKGEIDGLRTANLKDVKDLDDRHKDELERSALKIVELRNNVSQLQKQVKSMHTAADEQKLPSQTTKMESEIADLKQQLLDTEGRLNDERRAEEKKFEKESQKAKMERDCKLGHLSTSQVELGVKAGRSDDTEQEAQRGKSEEADCNQREELAAVADLQRQLVEARRGQAKAEAEAVEMRSAYESSMKTRISHTDQYAQILELKTALAHLENEAGQREQKLQQQRAEFRSRAEQADVVAARAERDAKEAAEVARLAHDRSRTALELERRARHAAEVEMHTRAVESKAWEKFAQQQMQLNARDDDARGEVSIGASRRGLGGIPSKQGSRDGSKKRDQSKGGRPGKSGGTSGEEGVKKKASARPRLFG